MPKQKISEFNSNPALNTDIDSINIAEGCSPSGINDAIRELMSQLKDWQSGTSNDPYVVGSSGSLTLNQGTANTVPYLNGSKVVTSGTALSFDGSNLGLGVTPSAWGSNWKSLDMAYATTVATNDSGTAAFGSNWRNDGTNYIYKSGGYAGMYLSSSATSSVHRWFTAASGTAGNAITFTQAMTLDASGRFIVGATAVSGSNQVEIQSGLTNALWVQTGSTSSSNYVADFRTGSNASVLALRADNTALVSGNLLVGTTSSTFGANGIRINPTQDGGYLNIGHPSGSASNTVFCGFAYNGSSIGSVTQSGTTAVLFNTTSDQRLKENIADADSASTLIDSLKVRKFDWKSDNTHQRYGFVAQELVTVAPEAVHQPEDTEQMMAVDYSKLVPMLVKEVQSLRARVAQLESN